MKQLLALVILLPASAIAGQTVLYFNSTPGDYIGQGKEMIWTAEDPADFTAWRNYGGGVSISMDNFSYVSDYSQEAWWDLDFAPPYGTQLAVGSYEGATRYPFQASDEPGLSVSGDGRGCNQLSGRFDILELAYGTGGRVERFAADFEQRCENFMPPLYGSIRYNSDVPLATVLPGQIELLGTLNADGCLEATGPDGAIAELKGTSSQDGLSMSWTSSTGETGLGEYFQVQVEMEMPQVVTLTLADVNGNTKSITRSVCASDTTPPLIKILAPRAGQTIVGNNARVKVQISDLVDPEIKDYEVFVGRTLQGRLRDGYSSLKLFKDASGVPATTEITVTASDKSGNTGSATVSVTTDHDMSGR